MTTVTLEGFIEVDEKDLKKVKDELPLHIQLTQQEEGCLVFQVAEDEKSKYRFNVHEEFIDKKAFELHQERIKCSQWGAVTQDVKRNYSIKGI